MTTTKFEPAMADTTYEQRLLDRIEELETEKTDRLGLIDEQMRVMIRQRDEKKDLRSTLKFAADELWAMGANYAARRCDRIIEQTKSEGE